MVVCQAVGANSCKIDTENTPYIKNIKNHWCSKFMTKNKNKQLKNSRPILRYVARVYYLKVHSVDIYNDNDNDNDNNNITILIKMKQPATLA